MFHFETLRPLEKLPGSILIVDDDPDVRQTAKFILKQSFSDVRVEKDPRKLPFLISQYSYHVILLDMNYQPGETTGQEGLKWLETVRKLDEKISVVIITAYGEVDLAVQAMKRGAVDFIVKPWENERFLATITSAFLLSESRKEAEDLRQINKQLQRDRVITDQDMVGDSDSLQKMLAHIVKVSPTDANVLILGENGTGKELAAKMIHSYSKRSEKPFVKVDLGSLSSSLFESELFGHVKGAFTDAKENKVGRFEAANGGTLFLDEIGNIDLKHQVKLLSAIQNREIFRVGSSSPSKMDIRLICATNLSLSKMVDEGTFREDLYYRLNTFEITVPSLRERKKDIPLLVNFFLERLSTRYKKRLIATAEEMKKFKSYSWPGNIRELEHTVERAVILSDGPSLGLENIILGKNTVSSELANASLDELEKNAIQSALIKYHGKITQVAKELKIGRTTLYRKLKKYGL